MRRTHIVLIVSAAMTVGIYRCKDSGGTIVGPPSGGNLIANSSFESNGTPSLQGWQVIDTSVVRFSTDTPPDGGAWSIYIETVWGQARIQTAVALPEGTHHYKLSTWAKRQGVGGKISLIFNKAIRKSLTITDATWTVYTFNDTLTTVRGDSVVVELAGGSSQLFSGETYFDICKFERLD
jgi:hypothetical protein